MLRRGIRVAPHPAARDAHRDLYDRANLVKLTTHTVIENLLVGMVLVALVLWLFLGHGRAALITPPSNSPWR